MSIKVKVRANESLEQLIRRLRKACEREGMHKELKRREFYEKPSEIKRRKYHQTLRKSGQFVRRVDEKIEKRRIV